METDSDGHGIVARIWKQLGSPTYEELAGRSIYEVIAEWQERAVRAEQFISMQGYRRCDILACNCGSWHGGNASARLAEVDEALNEAGISTNGKTIIKALREHLNLEAI